METNVICPICNAHFKISENEHVVSNAVVIGKDSNLGNIFLRLEDDSRQQLERRGIDTSKYFSIASPKGDDVLMRWSDEGVPEKVDENDPVIIAIRKAGSVPNRRLFRRWITAQMFHGLSFEGSRYWNGGFTSWMKLHGFCYTWKMAVEEFRVQDVLSRNDEENFRLRNRWFNRDVAVSMCNSYIEQLRHYVDHQHIHKCKRVPYKKNGSKNFFLSDIGGKVFKPLEFARKKVEISSNPQELYLAMRDFYRGFPLKGSQFEQSAAWQDAYKGAGAYFTLRNLIMFHGVNYVGCSDYSSSLEALDRYAKNCQGYEMLGALKATIRRNGLDIKAKMAEWRKS